MRQEQHYYEYRVRGGDSLSNIIVQFFGIGPKNPGYTKHLNHIRSLNPQIKDPNSIRAGSLLRLGVIPPAKPVVAQTPARPAATQPPASIARPAATLPREFMLKDVSRQDEADFWLLSWLAERSNHLVIPGSVALGAQTNLLSPGNVRLIEQVSDLYADYKAGLITKGQYDYRRKQSLDRLRQNIGPFDRWLFGNQTPHEVVRIARHGGVPATQNIQNQASRLTRLASYGKSGGYVLAGVGVAASCREIANSDSRQEKNEIFVETVASTAVGTGLGVAAGIFLVSNPVGWGTALVLAVGSAAVSYGAGKAARRSYTLSGTNVDFVSGAGVDTVCR